MAKNTEEIEHLEQMIKEQKQEFEEETRDLTL